MANTNLIRKRHRGKSRVQNLVCIDLLESLARYQRGGTNCEDNVLVIQRAIADGRTQIHTNIPADFVIEEQQSQTVWRSKLQVRSIGDEGNLWRQVHIHPHVVQKQTG